MDTCELCGQDVSTISCECMHCVACCQPCEPVSQGLCPACHFQICNAIECIRDGRPKDLDRSISAVDLIEFRAREALEPDNDRVGFKAALADIINIIKATN